RMDRTGVRGLGGRDIVSTRYFADGAAYDPVTDRWREIPSPALSPRDRTTEEWTGKELVIWGGGTSEVAFGDGAAYDPVANQWRTLPPSPLEARFVEGHWSGKEILYWGGEDWAQVFGDGAAYDPAANTWRRLAESPLSGRVSTAQTWSGRELLIWGGSRGTYNTFLGDGAAYDPGTDRWRRLPSWEGRINAGQVPWTGREMLVWGGIVPTGAPGRTVEIKSAADGRRYVP
ncbi:MAG: hypothetical protein M3450_02360, partial [Actinomycetota bacterium]|nr:hypothetical protein [Actinomycetota bacterium]